MIYDPRKSALEAARRNGYSGDSENSHLRPKGSSAWPVVLSVGLIGFLLSMGLFAFSAPGAGILVAILSAILIIGGLILRQLTANGAK